MSLGGLIKQAINGEATWGDVLKKAENLFVNNVVDPVEVFAEQFLTDFGKAALAKSLPYVPELLSGATTIAVAGPKLLADLEQAAITTAEQDGLQVAQNALRVQLNAAQVAAVPESPAAIAAPVDSPEPQPAG